MDCSFSSMRGLLLARRLPRWVVRTRLARRLPRWVVRTRAWAALFGVLLCWSASADGAAGALLVSLELADSELSAVQIERALERELGVDVSLGAAATDQADVLVLRVTGAAVEARFRPAGGDVVSRQLELPSGPPSEQAEVVALLSSNLVRDEAGALLATLAPSPSPSPSPSSDDDPPSAVETEPNGATEAPEDSALASQAAGPESETAEAAAEPDGDAAQAKSPAEEPSPSTSPPELEPTPVAVALWPGLSFPSQLDNQRPGVALSMIHANLGGIRGWGASAVGQRVLFGGTGVLTSGVWHHVSGDFAGFSSSSVVTLHDGDVRGFVGSGVYTRVQGRMEGAQFGLVTGATRLLGVQGGLVNQSERVSGVQLGLVNIAQRAGTQVGLVNVATKEQDGVSVGLINLVPGVDHKLALWGAASAARANRDEPGALIANLGWKMLIDHFALTLHFGLAPDQANCAPASRCGVQLSSGLIAGGHVPLSKHLFLELDGQYRYASSAAATDTEHALAARASLGLQVWEGLGLVVGAGPELSVAQAQLVDAVNGSTDVSVRLRDTLFVGLQLF